MGDGSGARWVNTVLVVIVAFIGLHVLFVLFDGNPRNGIVQFVNSVARPFLLPFTGMFESDSPRTTRLIAALVAVVAYSLIAGLALAIGKRIKASSAHRRGEPAPGTPEDVNTSRRV